jgi:predicted RNA binding protein YcfA (HicA-like mRNA interferase family)
MPEYPVLKPKKVFTTLNKAGFIKIRQKGSHAQFKKGNMLVTVPVHQRDLPLIVIKSIIRQSGMTLEEFKEFLK